MEIGDFLALEVGLNRFYGDFEANQPPRNGAKPHARLQINHPKRRCISPSHSVAYDLVRQFVAVVGRAWEMLRKDVTDVGNGVDYRLRELAGLEVSRDLGSDLLPEIPPALRIDAFVADDGELPQLWCEEDQHAVAFAGL